MWELDYKESWARKNWCFWTVVLEKTLESPLDCKEIQPVHPKGGSLEGLMLKLKVQYFGHLMQRAHWFEKTPMLGNIEVRRRGWQRNEMVGWHHQLNGRGFGWTPRVGDGLGGLACCSSWGRKESDMTEQLNWIMFCLSNLQRAFIEFHVGKWTQCCLLRTWVIIILMNVLTEGWAWGSGRFGPLVKSGVPQRSGSWGKKKKEKPKAKLLWWWCHFT